MLAQIRLTELDGVHDRISKHVHVVRNVGLALDRTAGLDDGEFDSAIGLEFGKGDLATLHAVPLNRALVEVAVLPPLAGFGSGRADVTRAVGSHETGSGLAVVHQAEADDEAMVNECHQGHEHRPELRESVTHHLHQPQDHLDEPILRCLHLFLPALVDDWAKIIARISHNFYPTKILKNDQLYHNLPHLSIIKPPLRDGFIVLKFLF